MHNQNRTINDSDVFFVIKKSPEFRGKSILLNGDWNLTRHLLGGVEVYLTVWGIVGYNRQELVNGEVMV